MAYSTLTQAQRITYVTNMAFANAANFWKRMLCAGDCNATCNCDDFGKVRLQQLVVEALNCADIADILSQAEIECMIGGVATLNCAGGGLVIGGSG